MLLREWIESSVNEDRSKGKKIKNKIEDGTISMRNSMNLKEHK